MVSIKHNFFNPCKLVKCLDKFNGFFDKALDTYSKDKINDFEINLKFTMLWKSRIFYLFCRFICLFGHYDLSQQFENMLHLSIFNWGLVPSTSTNTEKSILIFHETNYNF